MNELLYELYCLRMERCKEDEKQAKTVRVKDDYYSLIEVPGLSIGSSLWQPSYHLAEFCSNLSEKVTDGKKVIELGAGIGLCGIAMAKKHHCDKVVITDRGELVPLIAKNIALNFVGEEKQVFSEKLDWKEHRNNPEKYDIVIASDVVYREELFQPLLKTILSLSKLSTRIYMSYKRRVKEESEFFEALGDHFEVERLVWGVDRTDEKDIAIFCMKKKPFSWLLQTLPSANNTLEKNNNDDHPPKKQRQ